MKEGSVRESSRAWIGQRGKKIREKKNVILALAGIVFLCSLPVFEKGQAAAHDMTFHLMRIEAIIDAWKQGQFPVRLSTLWFEGYGYPTSIFYGDIFLYIPALLRLCGLSVMRAYKVYIMLVNAATAVLSYYCFRKMFGKQSVALLSSLVYCSASYRFINIYIRAALGEYSAMTFLPLVAYGVYRIYMAYDPDRRERIKNGLILALGMTGLIQTHILTTETTVFVLVLLCIVLCKKTFTKAVLLSFFTAVAATVLINLFFIVPFLDYYINVPVEITNIIDGAAAQIQGDGVYPVQYFSFLQKPYGLSVVEIGGRMTMTPGMVLMLALVFSGYLWVNQKLDRRMKLMALFSVLMLYIASDLFPWNYLAAHFKIGNMLAQVQFPWRYISFAIIFLTLLFGMIVTWLENGGEKWKIRTVYSIVMTAVFLSATSFVSQYIDEGGIVDMQDGSEIDKYSSAMNNEYLRSGSTREVSHTVSVNGGAAEILSQNGTEMKLHCSTQTEADVTVPIFNYKGYQVEDESGKSYEIFDGANNAIAFHLPGGFDGDITVRFVSPWYWRLSEVLSLLSILVLVVWSVKGWKKQGESAARIS